MVDIDSEVIEAVLKGQNERFASLMKRYSGLGMYYFRQKWSFPHETAKDLLQEAFLRVYKGIPGFNSQFPFRAWLMAICRNLAIDEYKKERKNPEKILAKEKDSRTDMATRVEQSTMIQSALNVLPDRQREVIEMRYFWDMTSAEIGKCLDIPEGTVRSELFYARMRLLEILGEEKGKK